MTENIEKEKETKTIPFYPDHLKTEARVVIGIIIIVFIFGLFGLFYPIGIEEPADPLNTPDHIKPEWYFLGLYQLLKYLPKVMGSLIPIFTFLALFLWPFVDKKDDNKKQFRNRAILSAVFVIVMILLTIWGWVS